ncbi:MAG: gamma carbonic anhydrase family protein [Chloroflexi bacterium]|nr:gamma carbonic anhydrase family protein [Chloroflexota bacterium]
MAERLPAGACPWIDPSAFIAANAVLAGAVAVGPLASVWYGAILEGRDAAVSVGAGSSVQDRAVARGLPGQPVWIAEDVTIGHCAQLLGCRVERGAVVGLNATVLPGAVIGAGSLVAAGAVVPAGLVVPPGMLVAGNPATIKRPLSGRALQWQAKAAEDYQRLSRQYLARRFTPRR